MTQTLDLNKMGLAPISNMESNNINGGGFWEDLSELVKWSFSLMDANGLNSLTWTNTGDGTGTFASNVGSVFFQFS